MSANSYRPHLHVLPEDDANRQLANGFCRDVGLITRSMQVLPAAGGWVKALEQFEAEHVGGMVKYPNRHMLLLIDFDGRLERLADAKARIPGQVADRVFVLGVLTQPEELKSAMATSYEEIGMALAQDCREGTDVTWGHDLLRHNADEIERLRHTMRPFLFASD